MPRTDDDTWSITESVGATALFVAAARAFEARKSAPLAVDQFAEPLVRAAGGEWTEALDGKGPVFDMVGHGWFGENFQRYQGARTQFFDAFFAEAAASGVRQYVILASGLDSRAYRLAYPEHSRVFELDQPQVLDFKTQTLAGIGAIPAAGRAVVSIDLRHDWPQALVSASFNPAKPTAWLAEGLLMYLPPAEESRLLERIVASSAPGSWVAVEHMQPIDVEAVRQSMSEIAPDAPQNAPDESSDFADLIYNEPRQDPVEWFAEQGWAAKGVPLADYMARLGHPFTSPKPGLPPPVTPFSATTLVVAESQKEERRAEN